MRILVSNDDGVDAPGIRALAAALARCGDVWVAAPASEQSARSHALTMHHPLRVDARGGQVFAVDGTPADAVYLGLHHLVPGPVDIVVSGINRGQNVADDTWYSGTVGAAREAAMSGIPALAVSLDARPSVSDADRNWAAAGAFAAQLVHEVISRHTGERTVLNLNVPDLPLDQQRPLKVCALGARHYAPSVFVQRDPRGKPYYWVGGESSGFEDQPNTDGYWFFRGHPTLTPLHIDGTDRIALPAWQSFQFD